MSTEVKWRRGTTAESNAFTGALAEITVDTDEKTLRVHDNITPGGSPLANKKYVTGAQEELLPPGSQIYPDDGSYLANGMTVTPGTTHLRALVGGETVILVAWDTLILPATVTTTPTSANDFLEYEVVTDQGAFKFVTIENYNKRSNGTAEGWGCSIDALDNSSQLNAYAQAANQFGFTFRIEKPYKITDTVSVPRNVPVKMNVALDATDAVSFSGSVALNIGEESLTQLTSVLTVDPEIYTNVISVTDGAEFSVGDVISIFNPTDFSFHAERDYYRDGELVQIHEISGDNLTLTKPLRSSYTAADMELWKFDTPNTADLDIKVKSSDGALFAVLLNMSVNSRIKLSVKGGDAGAVDRNLCFDCDYEIGRIEQTSTNTTLAYGLTNRNSSYQRDHGGSVEAARHAITNTGRDGVARPPCRGNRSLSQSLTNHPEETNTSAWDCHAVAEDCLAIDCDIYGGVVVGGANNGAPNCRIYQIENRVCFLEGSMVNTNHNFSGSDVYLTNVVTANSSLVTFGYTPDRLGVNLKSGGLLDFSNITIITTATDNASLKGLVNITVNDYAGGDIDVSFKGLRILIDGAVVNTNVIQIISGGTYWVRSVTLSSLESRGIAYLIECDNLFIDSMNITETDQTAANIQALSATIHKTVDVSDYKCSDSKYQGLALIAGSAGAKCNIGVARVNNCNQITSTNSRVRSGVSIEEFDTVIYSGIHAHTNSAIANIYPFYIRNCTNVYAGLSSYSGYDSAPQNDNNTTVTTMDLGLV